VPYHDYIAGKGSLLAFTRTSAMELGPKNVNVNMVSGGLRRTTEASAATPEAVSEQVAGMMPLRRECTPKEIADVVVFLAGP
jgi:3-oxoacyl-[acyl-carrier protein] reductase